METQFRAEKIVVDFGGLRALDDLTLEIRKGEILGLIGPNGAGKTTFFNCISRFIKPQTGTMNFEGTDLLRLGPQNIMRLGISRTFQNVNLFPTMSAIENILVGMHCNMGSFFAAILSLPSGRVKGTYMRRKAMEISHLLGLTEVLEQAANNLPFGFQKNVELARAVVSEPKLLLLDEPASGCNEEETAELARIIKEINRQLGISMLVVEHDMSMVMSICQRIYVLNFGRNIAEGTPEEIQNNPTVIEAYLGRDFDAEGG